MDSHSHGIYYPAQMSVGNSEEITRELGLNCMSAGYLLMTKASTRALGNLVVRLIKPRTPDLLSW